MTKFEMIKAGIVMISVYESRLSVTYSGDISESIESLVLELRSVKPAITMQEMEYSKDEAKIRKGKATILINRLLAQECVVLVEDRITNKFKQSRALMLRAGFNIYNTIYSIESVGSTIYQQDKRLSLQRLVFVAIALQKRIDKMSASTLSTARARAVELFNDGAEAVVVFDQYQYSEPKAIKSKSQLKNISCYMGGVETVYKFSRTCGDTNLLPYGNKRFTRKISVVEVFDNSYYKYESTMEVKRFQSSFKFIL